jgi:5'-3' exonuclease
VTVLDLIPGLKGTGSRRAVDKLAELRDENVKLLNRQAAADDFFAILTHDRDEVYAMWKAEKERRETAEKELEQAENAIRLRNQRIADLERRVDVGVKAEHVIARTQEIDPAEVRRYCVTPLHLAPMAAVTDPGHTGTH